MVELFVQENCKKISNYKNNRLLLINFSMLLFK